MKKTFCDRCEKEIVGIIHNTYQYFEGDLCSNCLIDYLKFEKEIEKEILDTMNLFKNKFAVVEET